MRWLKVRYHALTHPDYEGKELPLEINIDLDEKRRNKTVTISDTALRIDQGRGRSER